MDATSDALANVYLREKSIPPKKLEDAQHIAIDTCNQMDILLSWNFKHLSNIQKQINVKIINEKEAVKIVRGKLKSNSDGSYSIVKETIKAKVKRSNIDR